MYQLISIRKVINHNFFTYKIYIKKVLALFSELN